MAKRYELSHPLRPVRPHFLQCHLPSGYGALLVMSPEPRTGGKKIWFV